MTFIKQSIMARTYLQYLFILIKTSTTCCQFVNKQNKMHFNLIINQKQHCAFHAATQNHKGYKYLIFFVLMTGMHALDASAFLSYCFEGKQCFYASSYIVVNRTF